MTRTLNTIAREIRADWKQPYFGAVPYLGAMGEMSDVEATRPAVIAAQYYDDSARSVVLYFLANATTWRGEVARRVKAELKALAAYK